METKEPTNPTKGAEVINLEEVRRRKDNQDIGIVFSEADTINKHFRDISKPAISIEEGLKIADRILLKSFDEDVLFGKYKREREKFGTLGSLSDEELMTEMRLEIKESQENSLKNFTSVSTEFLIKEMENYEAGESKLYIVGINAVARELRKRFPNAK